MPLPIRSSSWQFLQHQFEERYMQNLIAFLKEQREKGVVYPPKGEVFQAFEYCPFDQTRVVILGQDPYHGAHQAQGLSFSVKKGIAIPPSLRNIYKELHDDLQVPIPNHGSLISWAQQGVLLLNAILTVQERSPLSHANKGWEIFTDQVCLAIAQRFEQPVVFILWGKYAADKIERVFTPIGKHPHLLLKSAHPSPYSAHNGFFGSRPFSKTNQFLLEHYQKEIDWRIT